MSKYIRRLRPHTIEQVWAREVLELLKDEEMQVRLVALNSLLDSLSFLSDKVRERSFSVIVALLPPEETRQVIFLERYSHQTKKKLSL